MATELTYKQATDRMPPERGPMRYQDLAGAIIQAGLLQTDATTPAASLSGTIAVDIKRKGQESAFADAAPE